MEIGQKIHFIADLPLYTLTSPSASCLKKTVALLAIPIFTILSLGYYLIHMYNYFSDRKISHLNTELERAVSNRQLERVQQLFIQAPALKKALNGEDGRTPNLLHIAVQNEDVPMAEYLVSQGADLHAFSRMGTPLAVALYRGRLNMAEWLLDKKVDPNLGHEYQTPVLLAITNNKPPLLFDLVNLLMRYNSSPNLTHYYFSPLALVAQHWNTDRPRVEETLRLMIQKGASLNPDDQIANPEARRFINDCPRT